jgi:hypothetical protein
MRRFNPPLSWLAAFGTIHTLIAFRPGPGGG